MRARTGKAARLTGVAFDSSVNELPEEPKEETPTETVSAEEKTSES
jgi:hypothetical protein